MEVYVMFDLLEHDRLIGVWSTEEKAKKWLRDQVECGSWTQGEAECVSIEAWEVDEVDDHIYCEEVTGILGQMFARDLSGLPEDAAMHLQEAYRICAENL